MLSPQVRDATDTLCVTPKSRDTSRGGACQIPREERAKMWNRWLCGFETVSKRYLFSSKRFVCDRE